jgi:hypothetical protein
MRNIPGAVAALAISAQILILSAASPAIAISADLAKKCREMAIKAHPPEPAGTHPYAQAERDFYHTCISNNGEMNGSSGGAAATTPQQK